MSYVKVALGCFCPDLSKVINELLYLFIYTCINILVVLYKLIVYYNCVFFFC